MGRARARRGGEVVLVSTVHRLLLGQSDEEVIAGLRHDFDWVSAELADMLLGEARASLARGSRVSANIEELTEEGGDTPTIIFETEKEAVVIVTITNKDGTTRTLTIRIPLKAGMTSEDIADEVDSQLDEWDGDYGGGIGSADWHVQYVY